MPLWKFYHPVNTLPARDRQALADGITRLYTGLANIPAFYVGVVFEEVAMTSFYIGGKPADNFVRIWIEHIDGPMNDKEERQHFLQAINALIAPYIRDKGLDWEFHVDETSVDLWSIQGFSPPAPGTQDEARWVMENKPSPTAAL